MNGPCASAEHVRPAGLSDIPALTRLLGQVLAVHNAVRPDLFKPVGAKYSEAELAELITDPARPVFVYAEPGTGRVLGHCFCELRHKRETGAVYGHTELFIDDLCVDETERGRRIGSALYEYVKQFAVASGASAITLHAWEGNPGALAFYRSLGLRVQQYTLEDRLDPRAPAVCAEAQN